MGWRLIVYCVLALALTGSFLFITIEMSLFPQKKIILQYLMQKKLKLDLLQKQRNFYTIESEMINALSNSNNLSIFKPKIEINNKDSYLVKLSANKVFFSLRVISLIYQKK